MNDRSWKWRRVAIFFTIASCAAVVGYLAVCGEDTRLSDTLAFGSFLLWGSVVGSYVFGAVWDDNMFDKLNARKDQKD